jgi:hypothetical protein
MYYPTTLGVVAGCARPLSGRGKDDVVTTSDVACVGTNLDACTVSMVALGSWLARPGTDAPATASDRIAGSSTIRWFIKSDLL